MAIVKVAVQDVCINHILSSKWGKKMKLDQKNVNNNQMANYSFCPCQGNCAGPCQGDCWSDCSGACLGPCTGCMGWSRSL